MTFWTGRSERERDVVVFVLNVTKSRGLPTLLSGNFEFIEQSNVSVFSK